MHTIERKGAGASSPDLKIGASAPQEGEKVRLAKGWYQFKRVPIGWKMFELVKVNGKVGYISGRRANGRFSVKDAASGKLLEDGIGHKKLVRLARAALST